MPSSDVPQDGDYHGPVLYRYTRVLEYIGTQEWLEATIANGVVRQDRPLVAPGLGRITETSAIWHGKVTL